MATKLGSKAFSKVWLTDSMAKDDRVKAQEQAKQARQDLRANRIALEAELKNARAECRVATRGALDAADQTLYAGIGVLRTERRVEKKAIRKQCAVDTILEDVKKATDTGDLSVLAPYAKTVKDPFVKTAEAQARRDKLREEQGHIAFAYQAAARKRKPRSSATERRQEREEETLRDIPAEYHALYRKFGRRMPAPKDQSRAEQFLGWLHDHPEAVFENSDAIERDVEREMEREMDRRQAEHFAGANVTEAFGHDEGYASASTHHEPKRAKREPKPRAQREPKPAAKREPKPAAKREPKPAAKREPKPRAKPQVRHEVAHPSRALVLHRDVEEAEYEPLYPIQAPKALPQRNAQDAALEAFLDGAADPEADGWVPDAEPLPPAGLALWRPPSFPPQPIHGHGHAANDDDGEDDESGRDAAARPAVSIREASGGFLSVQFGAIPSPNVTKILTAARFTFKRNGGRGIAGAAWQVRDSEHARMAANRALHVFESEAGRDPREVRRAAKVAAADAAGVIRSDDPEAIAKLRKRYESAKGPERSRIMQRIQQLVSVQRHEGKAEQIGDARIVWNVGEHRLQVFFPGKPDETTRKALRKLGHVWAPSVPPSGAWQRPLRDGDAMRLRAMLRERATRLGLTTSAAEPEAEAASGPPASYVDEYDDDHGHGRTHEGPSCEACGGGPLPRLCAVCARLADSLLEVIGTEDRPYERVVASQAKSGLGEERIRAVLDYLLASHKLYWVCATCGGFSSKSSANGEMPDHYAIGSMNCIRPVGLLTRRRPEFSHEVMGERAVRSLRDIPAAVRSAVERVSAASIPLSDTARALLARFLGPRSTWGSELNYELLTERRAMPKNDVRPAFLAISQALEAAAGIALLLHQTPEQRDPSPRILEASLAAARRSLKFLDRHEERVQKHEEAREQDEPRESSLDPLEQVAITERAKIGDQVLAAVRLVVADVMDWKKPNSGPVGDRRLFDRFMEANGAADAALLADVERRIGATMATHRKTPTKMAVYRTLGAIQRLLYGDEHRTRGTEFGLNLYVLAEREAELAVEFVKKILEERGPQRRAPHDAQGNKGNEDDDRAALRLHGDRLADADPAEEDQEEDAPNTEREVGPWFETVQRAVARIRAEVRMPPSKAALLDRFLGPSVADWAAFGVELDKVYSKHAARFGASAERAIQLAIGAASSAAFARADYAGGHIPNAIGRAERALELVDEGDDEEKNDTTPIALRVGLVACTKQKVKGVRKAPARDLYVGPGFRDALRYAEATCDRVFILSAKWGAISPDVVIETYDQELKAKHAAEWFDRLRPTLVTQRNRLESVQLVILAGETYAAPFLAPGALPDAWPRPETPLAGMGTGLRRQWLAARVRELNAAGSVVEGRSRAPRLLPPPTPTPAQHPTVSSASTSAWFTNPDGRPVAKEVPAVVSPAVQISELRSRLARLEPELAKARARWQASREPNEAKRRRILLAGGYSNEEAFALIAKNAPETKYIATNLNGEVKRLQASLRTLEFEERRRASSRAEAAEHAALTSVERAARNELEPAELATTREATRAAVLAAAALVLAEVIGEPTTDAETIADRRLLQRFVRGNGVPDPALFADVEKRLNFADKHRARTMAQQAIDSTLHAIERYSYVDAWKARLSDEGFGCYRKARGHAESATEAAKRAIQDRGARAPITDLAMRLGIEGNIEAPIPDVITTRAEWERAERRSTFLRQALEPVREESRRLQVRMRTEKPTARKGSKRWEAEQEKRTALAKLANEVGHQENRLNEEIHDLHRKQAAFNPGDWEHDELPAAPIAQHLAERNQRRAELATTVQRRADLTSSLREHVILVLQQNPPDVVSVGGISARSLLRQFHDENANLVELLPYFRRAVQEWDRAKTDGGIFVLAVRAVERALSSWNLDRHDPTLPALLDRVEQLTNELSATRVALRGDTAPPVNPAKVREDYAAHKEQRIERLEERADKVGATAESTLAHARKLADVIPFGQPIHVGHYSEKSDRSFRAKIHRTYERGHALLDEAKDLARRAVSAAKNAAISSDDPQAIELLTEKLATLEELQALMVASNKAIKAAQRAKGDPVAALVELGHSPKDAAALMAGDALQNIGFADYRLTNNSAEIRRTKKRIADLTAHRAAPAVEAQIGDIRIHEADNRIKLTFPDRPPAEVRAYLNQNGFHWKRSEGVWQRQSSRVALHVATKAAEMLGGALEAPGGPVAAQQHEPDQDDDIAPPSAPEPQGGPLAGSRGASLPDVDGSEEATRAVREAVGATILLVVQDPNPSALRRADLALLQRSLRVLRGGEPTAAIDRDVQQALNPTKRAGREQTPEELAVTAALQAVARLSSVAAHHPAVSEDALSRLLREAERDAASALEWGKEAMKVRAGRSSSKPKHGRTEREHEAQLQQMAVRRGLMTQHAQRLVISILSGGSRDVRTADGSSVIDLLKRFESQADSPAVLLPRFQTAVRRWNAADRNDRGLALTTSAVERVLTALTLPVHDPGLPAVLRAAEEFAEEAAKASVRANASGSAGEPPADLIAPLSTNETAVRARASVARAVAMLLGLLKSANPAPGDEVTAKTQNVLRRFLLGERPTLLRVDLASTAARAKALQGAHTPTQLAALAVLHAADLSTQYDYQAAELGAVFTDQRAGQAARIEQAAEAAERAVEALRVPRRPANDAAAPSESVDQAIAEGNRRVRAAEYRDEKARHYVGAKYVRDRELRDTAKLIRQELAAAGKVKPPRGQAITPSSTIDEGQLSGVVCRVSKSERDQLRIEIIALPDGVEIANPARVARDDSLAYHDLSVPRYTPRAEAIERAVRSIANAYNYQASDTHSDVHNYGFALSVEFGAGMEEASRDKIRRSVAKEGARAAVPSREAQAKPAEKHQRTLSGAWEPVVGPETPAPQKAERPRFGAGDTVCSVKASKYRGIVIGPEYSRGGIPSVDVRWTNGLPPRMETGIEGATGIAVGLLHLVRANVPNKPVQTSLTTLGGLRLDESHGQKGLFE